MTDPKNMIQETIKNLILNTLTKLGLPEVSFAVEHPGDLTHGDYSTNVAFMISANLKKTDSNVTPFRPLRELADSIVGSMNKNLPPEISKVEALGPGFINFYLSESFFAESIKTILEHKENWGKNDELKNKKVLIEHSSPNLFKPFHIGHVMNNTIGESLTRLAHFSGAEVVLISYPSDVSLGIGKAVYVLLQKGIHALDQYKTLQEKLTFLGTCYVEGTRLYDEDKTIEPTVRDITQKIYNHIQGLEFDAYEIGKKINLDYFKEITQTLGSQFDDFIYESEAGVVGKKIVQENTPAIFTKSEGATIYEGEQDGLHTRVFINKEGYPTYEAKDIGLLSLKFERFNPDISIFITDHEQTEYFRVVSTAAGKICKEWQDKTVHLTHGRMTFKGQKMSSRLGGVPTAKDTLDTLFEAVGEIAKHELTAIDRELIAISALKYSILRAEAGKNINFDPETSLSFEGDSGPYLLYSTIRSKSILEKAEKNNLEKNTHRPNDLEITHLEKLLYRFPEIVSRSLQDYSTHHITIYLTELAQAFNSFYGNTHILNTDDENTQYYVQLTESFKITMQNGLYLLGITLPSKM